MTHLPVRFTATIPVPVVWREVKDDDDVRAELWVMWQQVAMQQGWKPMGYPTSFDRQFTGTPTLIDVYDVTGPVVKP